MTFTRARVTCDTPSSYKRREIMCTSVREYTQNHIVYTPSYPAWNVRRYRTALFSVGRFPRMYVLPLLYRIIGSRQWYTRIYSCVADDCRRRRYAFARCRRTLFTRFARLSQLLHCVKKKKKKSTWKFNEQRDKKGVEKCKLRPSLSDHIITRNNNNIINASACARAPS